MSLTVLVVFALIFLVYGLLNYYIGRRGWQSLFGHVPALSKKAYWLAIWMMALAYFAGRLGADFLPAGVSSWLNIVGAYWLAAMFYLILLLVFIDLIRLADRWIHFVPVKTRHNPKAHQVLGLSVFLLVVGILIYGSWNAQHPQVTHYDLTVGKQAGAMQDLHIVMVSDIHLGTIVHNGQLAKMVNLVNAQKPDLILFAGDIIDENIEPVSQQEVADNFRNLKAKYGVYAVPGNHEYIGRHSQEIADYLNQAGVTVLRDETVKVADSFYIIGRDDLSGEEFSAGKRKDLASLMAGLDKSLPVIVLDHQPLNLAEGQAQGVNLQLSGHTHVGQLFPNQLITGRMYEDDYGLLRKGDFKVIVSSGYGTWGPPIRVGNSPEVVDVEILFGRR